MTSKDPAAHPRFPMRTMARGLVLDIGPSLAAYYVLRSIGVHEWMALLAATLVAGARVAWIALRTRSANLFAMVMLVVFGLGLALAFVTGDARFLLLKDSITTATIGLIFLVTVMTGHPLTLAAMTARQPARAGEITAGYREFPEIRRSHLVASTVWGVGLLTEAAVRIPLIYLLPIDVMVGLSSTLLITALAALLLWTGWYARRVTHQLL